MECETKREGVAGIGGAWDEFEVGGARVGIGIDEGSWDEGVVGDFGTEEAGIGRVEGAEGDIGVRGVAEVERCQGAGHTEGGGAMPVEWGRRMVDAPFPGHFESYLMVSAVELTFPPPANAWMPQVGVTALQVGVAVN